MPSKRTSEAAFETAIESVLLAGGYARVAAQGFDRERALFPDEALAFIRATLIVAAVNALPALLDAAAERDALAESVRAYGRTIDRWGLLIIAATHSEDITTPDGDGDWEVIESRLAEVPALLAERDALAAKVERVRALHGPRVLQVLGATCSAEECDHEDACPLVDYTVCGHCYDVGDGAHPCAYEEGGLQDVAHPCATRRALDATPET